MALRLLIGWHFFSEGTSHLNDKTWSSEGFLRQAKGPLAEYYQSRLPEFHEWSATLHGSDLNPAKAAEAWHNKVTDAWDRLGGTFNGFYALTDPQRAQTKAIVARHKERLAGWFEDWKSDLQDYVLDAQRLERLRTTGNSQEAAGAKKKDADGKESATPATPESSAADDVPFLQKRVADGARELSAKASEITAEVRAIESGLADDLESVLTAEQKERGKMDGESTALARFDRRLAYGILVIGACLILGLFTRLAAVGGAAFLLSVVAAQPFWIAGTQPTFNQWVELVALLALATSHVGRWGGLDFFIHNFVTRNCCGSRGTSHASNA